MGVICNNKMNNVFCYKSVKQNVARARHAGLSDAALTTRLPERHAPFKHDQQGRAREE
jgi:hypothetical protein